MAAVTRGERVGRLALGPLLLLGWEVAGRRRWIDAEVLSLPSAIVRRTVTDLLSGQLLPHVGITVMEMVLGFLAGAIVGVACGFLLAAFPVAQKVLMPYLTAVYSIPRPALAPLFVLWFGVGFLSKLILVVTLVYFVFLLHVMAGIQTIERRHLDWLRTLGASRADVVRRLALPHLLPWLFSSCKLGLALGLIGAIVGEFISSRAGIGFLMIHAAENLDREGVMAGMLVLALIVVGVVIPLDVAERRLFRWRGDVRL